MTFSISWAMTLRWMKSAFAKILRKMRSVRMCWMIISSTASTEMLGLSEPRQREQKSSKAVMNFLLVWRSVSMRALQAGADLRDFVAELLDGLFPVGHSGRGEFEEESEDVDELVGIGEVGFVKTLGVLVEDGAVGLPEEDVLLGVAEGELDLDLFVEVVGGVFGFPEAMVKAVVVEEGAVGFGVGLAFALDCVFGDEVPIEVAGAVFEEFLKGEADGGFVLDAEPGEPGQRLVVECHGLVGRL